MRYALITSATLLALACAVQAAPPKKEATLGKTKPGAPIMTKAQLKACLTQQDGIRARAAETVKLQEDMTAERAEIERSGAALKEEVEKIDRTNKEAVDAFNARTADRDRRIDAYQARIAPFNAKVEALQAERASYDQACEGRRYLEDEYTEIKAGK